MSNDTSDSQKMLEQFEELARKLLKVPKAEVDAAEAARPKRKPRSDRKPA